MTFFIPTEICLKDSINLTTKLIFLDFRKGFFLVFVISFFLNSFRKRRSPHQDEF